MVMSWSWAAQRDKGDLDQVVLIFLPVGVTSFWKVGIHLPMGAGVSIAITRRQVMQAPAPSFLQAMRV